MKRLVILFLLMYAANCLAQYPRVTIPGSEIRNLTSSIITGQGSMNYISYSLVIIRTVQRNTRLFT